MIRLCVADHHPILLAGMQAWLEVTGGITVVGTAGTGETALAILEALKPDVALVDLTLSGVNALELARRARVAGLPTRVIIFSATESLAQLRLALEAGVSGYVLKRSAVDHLVLAIRAVHAGGTYFDPAISAAFWTGMAGTGPESLASVLTARETEVLRAVAFGFSLKETAGLLGITGKSVETYKTRACEKLRLGSRAQIVRHALSQGWFADGADPADMPAPVRGLPPPAWPSRH